MSKKYWNYLIILLLTVSIVIASSLVYSQEQESINPKSPDIGHPVKLGEETILYIKNPTEKLSAAERAQKISDELKGIAESSVIDLDQFRLLPIGENRVIVLRNFIITFIPQDFESEQNQQAELERDLLQKLPEVIKRYRQKHSDKNISAYSNDKNISTYISAYFMPWYLNNYWIQSLITIILMFILLFLIVIPLYLPRLRFIWHKIYEKLLASSKTEKKNGDENSLTYKIGSLDDAGRLIVAVYHNPDDYVIYRTNSIVRWKVKKKSVNDVKEECIKFEKPKSFINKSFISKFKFLPTSFKSDDDKKETESALQKRDDGKKKTNNDEPKEYENLRQKYKNLRQKYENLLQKYEKRISKEYKNQRQEYKTLLQKYEKRISKVFSLLAEIESQNPEEIGKSETINIQIARGIRSALEDEEENSKKVLEQAKNRLQKFRNTHAKLQYLIGSFYGSSLIIFSLICLMIAPILFSSIFMDLIKIFKIDTIFIIVIGGGALGGFLSVASGINKITIDPDDNVFVAGISRTLIAVTSSIVFFIALKSNIFPDFTKGFMPNLSQPNFWKVAFISVAAGFTESLVPNLLKLKETQVPNK